jgi:biopolymer transport protein ExbD
MAGGGGPIKEGELNNEINVVPLVDIMLVLLIIFIITIPVATKAIKVVLPTNANVPTETKPENISLSVDFAGTVYWNDGQISLDDLAKLAQSQATQQPQPEVQIRADKRVAYAYVADVLTTLQRNYLLKVAFIAEPPHQE